MEKIEKGAKRKCTKCSTLFFDFGKYPIVCPNCGADVTSLLTNVSRRGRPPKNAKPNDVSKESKEVEIQEIEEIEVEETAEDVDGEESNVEDIVEIERDQE
tara:strand:+ start:602 stop:904 length:303 start_codon:yes stop_codon:yes gene_type:complete